MVHLWQTEYNIVAHCSNFIKAIIDLFAVPQESFWVKG